MTRFPDFLIIGAMKAGTTTLYRDLRTNPNILMPEDKEPNNLCSDKVLTEEGRSEYAALFQAVKPGQICGEASTAYTKYPDYKSVAERAKKICGAGLKIVYVVREPIQRIVSQYHHEHSFGLVKEDINTAVRIHPRFLNYSRYYMQIKPWIDQFGEKNVKILVFENYIQNRISVTSEVCNFLQVNPMPELVVESEVYNRSTDKIRGLEFWFSLSRNAAYRKWLRPLLPWRIRHAVLQHLLPKASISSDSLTDATMQYLRENLSEDFDKLFTLTGVRNSIWQKD